MNRWSVVFTLEWSEKSAGDSFWSFRQYTGERRASCIEVSDTAFYGLTFMVTALWLM